MYKCNTGCNNKGNWNYGNCNDGSNNSGNRNDGNYNTGRGNSGSYNSGHNNQGSYNSGDNNCGSYNNGDWNNGWGNWGYFNTEEPTLKMFNEEVDYDIDTDDIEFPGFFNFALTEFIPVEKMTLNEKLNNVHYDEVGGYLKVYTYKEAWRKAWDGASEEDKKMVLLLPNFDNDIFEQITGIDVEKELCLEVKNGNE